MVVEVESNPNCESSLYARFKESGPARRVVKVRTFERRSEGEWCWVTGWTDSPDNPRCAAHAQLVEDSGFVSGTHRLELASQQTRAIRSVTVDMRQTHPVRLQTQCGKIGPGGAFLEKIQQLQPLIFRFNQSASTRVESLRLTDVIDAERGFLTPPVILKQ